MVQGPFFQVLAALTGPHAWVLAPMINDGPAPGKWAHPANHFSKDARYRCAHSHSKGILKCWHSPLDTLLQRNLWEPNSGDTNTNVV